MEFQLTMLNYQQGFTIFNSPEFCIELFVDPLFSEALEIMAYCLYDGKVDQGSEFETSLYQSLFYQLKDMKECFILFFEKIL